ncbi:MAG: response regulator [Proteobacteria bacterium]|nr:response regulator [Pseudomonadota bacterium]
MSSFTNQPDSNRKNRPIHSGHILIVEDDKLLASQFARVLTRSGYTCSLAEDVFQAMHLIEKKPIDLHIVDLRMPVPSPSGLEYIQKLRQKRNDTAVIIITALEDDSTIHQALSLDLYGYLIKPVSDKQLSVCVDNAMCRIAVEKELQRQINSMQAFMEIETQLALLSTIIDTIPNPVYYKNREGRFINANKAFLEFKGLERRQVIGKTAFDFLPQDRAQQHDEIDQRLLKNPGLEIYELTVARTDGSPRNIIFHKASFIDTAGEIGGLVSIMIDITELTRTANELIKSQSIFKSIVQRSIEAILIVSHAGNILFANDGAELLFGRPADMLVGNECGYPLTSGKPVEIEIVLSKNKRGVGEMRSELTKWGNQLAYLVSIRDITDRVAAEEKLKQTISELKKANQIILNQQKSVIEEERLKVLLQLAGATANELSQPLMVLMGYVSLLKANIDDRKKTTSYLQELNLVGERITEIVNRMRTIRHDLPIDGFENNSLMVIDRDISILIVDDSEVDYQQIKSMLSESKRISLHHCKTIQSAIEQISNSQIDLILLDYLLPDGTGLNLNGSNGNR